MSQDGRLDMRILRGCGGSYGGRLFAFRTRRGYMFAGVVFLNFDEILLSVRTDLNDVFGANVGFNLFPRTAILFEGVEKELMFFVGPIFSGFGDDVLFARLLVGRLGWSGWGRVLLRAGRVCGKCRLVREFGRGCG